MHVTCHVLVSVHVTCHVLVMICIINSSYSTHCVCVLYNIKSNKRIIPLVWSDYCSRIIITIYVTWNAKRGHLTQNNILRYKQKTNDNEIT